MTTQTMEMDCKNCGHTIWKNDVNPKWGHQRIQGIGIPICGVKVNGKYCRCKKPEPDWSFMDADEKALKRALKGTIAEGMIR